MMALSPEYITTDERNPRMFLIESGKVPKWTSITVLRTSGGQLIRLTDDQRDFLNDAGFELTAFTGTIRLAGPAVGILKSLSNFRG